MLTHPTHERLITLGLTGMAKAFEEQRRSPDLDALPFEERIGLLVDREAAERDTKRLTTRLKFAALRQSACVEDVDLRTPRGIDRAVFARLVGGDWIDRNENLLVTGATGLGKSWMPAPSATRLAATIARSNITACRACSRRSPLLAATVAMAACSKPSAAFNS
jgi:DNA replication protein DnaC